MIDGFTKSMSPGTALYLCIAAIAIALTSVSIAIYNREELFIAPEETVEADGLHYTTMNHEGSSDEDPDRRSWLWVMPSVALQSIALNCAISFIVPLKIGFYTSYYGGQLQAFEKFPDVQSNLDTTTALLVFFTAGAIGELSDSFGRKPFFLAANVLNTIPIVLLYLYAAGFTTDLWSYNYCCVATGILGATYAGNGILSAIIADTTTKDERMKAYGYLFAAFSVGFCVSPIIGAYIASYLSNAQAMGFAMVLCILNCLYTLIIFPETLPSHKRKPFDGFSAQYLLDLIVRPVCFMLKNKLILCLAAISFLGNFPENGVQENSLNFLQNQIGFMSLDNAWVFFQTGFFCVVIQITLLIFIADAAVKVNTDDPEKAQTPSKSEGTRGKTSIILLGLFSQLLHLGGYIWGPWIEHKTWFFAIETLSAMSFIMAPAIQDVVSARLSSTDQGLGLGALSAVNGLASGTGPFVLGKVFSHAMTPDGKPVLNIDFSTMKPINPCGFPRGLTKPLPAALTAYIIGAACVALAIFLTLCLLPRLVAQEESEDEERLLNGDSDLANAFASPGVKTQFAESIN